VKHSDSASRSSLPDPHTFLSVLISDTADRLSDRAAVTGGGRRALSKHQRGHRKQ